MPSMFRALAPVMPLRPFVAGYWFVEDLPGVHAGLPVQTSPFPGAVLTVNFGRPNAMIDGPLVPTTSLLGVQTVGRGWRSWEETSFVMVMLTVPGLVRLFPHGGGASADALVELGGMLGDAEARGLATASGATEQPERVGRALDAWLLGRLERVAAVRELPRLTAACGMLGAGRQVQAAAAAVGVTRRQLGRWFREHVGVGPKVLADVMRLDASVRAVQRGHGDALEGFADQPHQIRAWRRRLGLTPGRYGRAEPSPMAVAFGRRGDAPAFYL